LGWGKLEWLPLENTAVAAYLRRYQDEALLILNNLSGSQQSVDLTLSTDTASIPKDILSGNRYPGLKHGQLALTLHPFQYLWLKL
jgi:hypothetical protein